MYFKRINWLCKRANGLVFYMYCHHSEKERHLPRFLIWKNWKEKKYSNYYFKGECTPNVVWLLKFTLLVLGAFAKSRRATICFVRSVCPSVLPAAWNNSARRTGTSHDAVCTFMTVWQYLAELFLEWETLQLKIIEKIKTHFLFV
jgi:hypothetical protein